MMDEITPYATKVVEVVASPEAQAEGKQGMIFDEMDMMAAAELLGPKAHQEAADALIEAINSIR